MSDQLSTCILCGRPRQYIGVFVPRGVHHEAFGGIPGKTSFIFYGLCERCMAMPGTPERVEDVIQPANGRPMELRVLNRPIGQEHYACKMAA